MSVQKIRDYLDYFGEEVDDLKLDVTIDEEEDAKVLDLSDLEEELTVQAEDYGLFIQVNLRLLYIKFSTLQVRQPSFSTGPY